MVGRWLVLPTPRSRARTSCPTCVVRLFVVQAKTKITKPTGMVVRLVHGTTTRHAPQGPRPLRLATLAVTRTARQFRRPPLAQETLLQGTLLSVTGTTERSATGRTQQVLTLTPSQVAVMLRLHLSTSA